MARRLAAALFLLAAGAPATAPAAVRTVEKCDGHPDGADAPAGGLPGQLRFLINAATAGDLIVIPAGCVITLGGPAGDNDNLGGDLDLGKDLTIQGAGPGRSIIDGNGVDRVLDVSGLATVAVSGVTVRNGRVGDGPGGGVLVGGISSLALRNVHVVANTVEVSSPAPLGGGLIHLSTGTLALDHVTVSGNRADLAGGLHLDGGSVRLRNVTISGNRAEGGGGGLLAESDATLTMDGVTIAGNVGGGLLVTPTAGGGSVTLRNTLIAGNTPGPGSPPGDCATGPLAVVSLGSNLVANPNACAGLLPTDLTGVDPLLGPLASNGGPTPTHALLPGSPALDAGDGGCLATDQRGVERPQGPRCDIGGFEAGGGRAGAFPDLDGDGGADLVVAGAGEVRVLGGSGGTLLLAFTPFGGDYAGPLSVAACDLTADGTPDLVVGGPGPGGPELRAIDGRTGAPLPGPLGAIPVFGPPAVGPGRTALLAPPAVACADVDGDGTPDLIAGAPAGSAPAPLRVLDGRDGGLLAGVEPFTPPGPAPLAVGP